MMLFSDGARAVFMRFPANGSGYQESFGLATAIKDHDEDPDVVMKVLQDLGFLRRGWIEGGNCGPGRRIYRLSGEGKRVRREMADSIGQQT